MRGLGRRVRLGLDAALVASLLFQMTRQFLPGAVHEVAGVAFVVLAAAHVAVNRRALAALARGRWSARRAALVLVDALLALACLAAVACGVGMSGAAVSLGLAHGTASLRGAHLALVHAAFLLCGVHLGLHATPWLRRVRRRLGACPAPRVTRVAASAVALAACVCGAWCFVHLSFAGYLSGRVRFAFIDPSQSVAVFVAQNMAVLVLAAGLGAMFGRATSGLGRRGPGPL